MPHASRRTFHLHSPTLPDPKKSFGPLVGNSARLLERRYLEKLGQMLLSYEATSTFLSEEEEKTHTHHCLTAVLDQITSSPLCVFASRKIHCRCRHPKISQSLNFKRGQHKAAGVISTFNSQNLVADLQPPPAQQQHLRLRPLTIPAIDRPPTALYPRRPVHD